MRYGYSETCLEHDPGPRHPESPDRLRAVRRRLSRCHGVEYVEADPATVADAEAVHDAGYVDRIRSFCEDGGGNWDPDTVATGATWSAALASAGQAVWAAREAATGASGRETPFALGRPPGHHATADDAMGFCFLNNVAVAAECARRETAVERVAIVDWDVHHGNGTQDVFYDDPATFYASIHEADLYPGTGEVEETGGPGDAAGTNLNVPLPAGAGDVEYRAVLDDLFDPAIRWFDADLVLVSAGFDAHRHDPISRMHVSTEGFGLMAGRLRELADDLDAGLGFVLEGGYGMDTLADGVAAVHETFDGREPVEPEGDLDDGVATLLAEIAESHPALE